MKKFLLILATCCSSALSFAQNPVLMTINGKDVTRAEFEYAYNKNNNVEGAVEQKSIEEYVDMFINYKLKVAEAESQKIDTLKSFNEEFRTYRDMQLIPYFVDQQFIDSVALSLYDRQVEAIGGKDLLDCSHILLLVKQTATNAEKEKVAARADSVYQALKAGADFAELAKQVSQDPGSAIKGGMLPTIYPGMTIKEFEDQAYMLKPGEMSAPFLTPVGYHIVKMTDRKQLDSYETLYPTIIAALKRQNIEEASAKAKIEKLTATTGKSREEILLEALEAHKKDNPDLEYLVTEYHDGLLLYEVAKARVWDPASEDQVALGNTFLKNKKKYKWSEPRFSGFIISAKDATTLKAAKKLLKKGLPEGKELRDLLKETLNKDSVIVMASGPYLVKKGENSTIDNLFFGDKTKEVKPLRKNYTLTDVVGKKKKQPKNYQDVKNEVSTDLQQDLESQWVEELRKKYTFSVNKDVLKTVNNHQ